MINFEDSPILEYNTMPNVDLSLLNQLRRKNKTTAAVFKALADRRRFKPVTDIRRIRMELREEKFEISYAETVAIFRGLEKAGMGKMVANERGFLDRFQWNYKSDQLKRFFQGETESLEEPRSDRPESISVDTNAPVGYLDFLRVVLTNDHIDDKEKVRMVRSYFHI